jgi:putative tryptophan/tyrosine transport system substrate-binding protein
MKISVRQQSEEIIPHKKTARTSMSKKIFCHALIAMLLGLSAPATAQQPARIPRIGYVSGTGSSSNPGPYVEALRQGLRDLGHVDGKNIVIEYRGAEGRNDPIPSLVNELVQLKVDVLVVPVLPAIRAAKQATKTIPIVMVTQADPVATGIIDSLAAPVEISPGSPHFPGSQAESVWN